MHVGTLGFFVFFLHIVFFFWWNIYRILQHIFGWDCLFAKMMSSNRVYLQILYPTNVRIWCLLDKWIFVSGQCKSENEKVNFFVLLSSCILISGLVWQISMQLRAKMNYMTSTITRNIDFAAGHWEKIIILHGNTVRLFVWSFLILTRVFSFFIIVAFD